MTEYEFDDFCKKNTPSKVVVNYDAGVKIEFSNGESVVIYIISQHGMGEFEFVHKTD